MDEDEAALTPFQRAQRHFQRLQLQEQPSPSPVVQSIPAMRLSSKSITSEKSTSVVSANFDSTEIPKLPPADSSQVNPFAEWVQFKDTTLPKDDAGVKSFVSADAVVLSPTEITQAERGRPRTIEDRNQVPNRMSSDAIDGEGVSATINPFNEDESSDEDTDSDGEHSPLRKSAKYNTFRDPLAPIRSQSSLSSSHSLQSPFTSVPKLTASSRELTTASSVTASSAKPALPPRPPNMLTYESSASAPAGSIPPASPQKQSDKPPLPLRPSKFSSTVSDVTLDSSSQYHSTTLGRSRDRAFFYPDGIESNRKAPLSSIFTDIHLKSSVKSLASSKGFIVIGQTAIRIWDPQRNNCTVVSQTKQDAKVIALAFVPSMEITNDGRFFWAGFSDGDLWMVDCLTGEVLERRVSAHSYPIHYIFRFRRQLWTLDDNGVLQIWFEPHPQSYLDEKYRSDMISLEGRPKTLRIASKQVEAILVGAHLWTAGERYIEVVAPMEESSLLKKRIDAAAGYGAITSLAVTRNALPQTSHAGAPQAFPNSLHDTSRYRVFTGHMDGKFVEWDASDFTKRRVFDMGSYRISSLLGVNDRHLWVATGTGKVLVLDVGIHPAAMENAVVIKEWQAESSDAIELMVLDRDSLVHTGQLLVAAVSKGGRLHLWNACLEDDFIDMEMKRLDSDYCTFHDIDLFIGSWNIDASKPEHLEARAEDTYLFDRWLSIAPPEGPAVVMFGFQEIVDLESKTGAAKGLLKNAAKKQESQMTLQQQDYTSRAHLWRDRLVKALRDKFKSSYQLMDCRNLVGIFTCLFVKEDLIEKNLVRSVFSHTVSTGLGGAYGNKGAIVTRFIINDSSLCFVTSHLPAHQTKVGKRNVDAITIIRSPGLPACEDEEALQSCFLRGGDGSQVLDHEFSFFFGDLNYRIDLAREEVLRYIEQKNWSALWNADQLIRQRLLGNTTCLLRIFEEGPLDFAPTYKYDPGTDDYDTSEKRRTPAWCDRILFRDGPARNMFSAIDPCRRIARVTSPVFTIRNDDASSKLGIASLSLSRDASSTTSNLSMTPIQPRIRQHCYRRFECKVSDHRPIAATFTVTTKRLNVKQRNELLKRVEMEWRDRMATILHEAAVEWLMLRVDAVSSDAGAYRQHVQGCLERNNGDLALTIRSLCSYQ